MGKDVLRAMKTAKIALVGLKTNVKHVLMGNTSK